MLQSPSPAFKIRSVAFAAVSAAAGLALLAGPPAHAERAGLESEHVFGFTQGPDLNDVGELDLEGEIDGGFGKRAGSYATISPSLGFEYVPIENFSIQPGISFSGGRIEGVPGLPDHTGAGLSGLSLELKYQFLDRREAPIGLTASLSGGWGRIDETSGEHVRQWGGELRLIADKELVKDRLFVATNLAYAPDTQRPIAGGAWAAESQTEISQAAAYQFKPGFLIGAEARWDNAFDGAGLDRRAGDALFLGPTVYCQFGERLWFSGAVSLQVAGHAAGETAALDLDHFSQRQAMLGFGYNF